jgi:GNAT superfamily N-acetyltransferase
LSLRLDLRAHVAGASPPAGFDVRELGRAEIETTLGATPGLARSVAELDAVAPSGWRCFVAFWEGAPVHVRFIETRPGRPLAFGDFTAPAMRKRGAYRAALAFVAARLHAEGEASLFSSVSGANRPSLRAHEAAGFVVVRRRFDVRVRGVSLRALARRIVRGH